MPNNQDQAVVTGLEPMAQTEPTQELAAPENSPEPETKTLENSPEPDITEPSKNEPIVAPALHAMAEAELRGDALRENIKRDFVQRVMEGRRKQEAPPPPVQPMPPRIAEQTLLEQKAGAAQVARAAEHQAAHGGPRPNTDGTTKPVFRPADYVPNQKKGQGYLNSRNVS